MANQYTAKTIITDTHAQCSKCGELKPHADFHKCVSYKHRKGCAYYCKECACANSRKNHNARITKDIRYKEDKKNSYIKTRYGITLVEYNTKLQKQGVCAICSKPLQENDPNVHLDHCHTTGRIRDFLCGNCNRGIGSFHDSTEKLSSAILYLKKHEETL